MESHQRLAIRLPNWLGDTLMTYPLLVQLHRAEIDFTCFGHPAVLDLFSATDFSMVGSSRIRDHLFMRRQYRAGAFTKAILCPSSFSALIPVKLSNLPSIGHHFMCSQRIRKNVRGHRVEHYYDLGRPLLHDTGSRGIPEDFIPLNDATRQYGKSIIDSLFTGPFVVVCPFASNLHQGQNKEWPYWKQFMSRYKDKPLLGLVSAQDVDRFQDEFPGTPVLSESLSVAAAIMREAVHVITNDSGAMHLASFFGAQVLGLFGVTNVIETRPWHGDYLTSANGKWADYHDVKAYLNSH